MRGCRLAEVCGGVMRSRFRFVGCSCVGRPDSGLPRPRVALMLPGLRASGVVKGDDLNLAVADDTSRGARGSQDDMGAPSVAWCDTSN